MQAGTLTKPKTLEDLNLKRDLVASLVLRTLAFSDRMSGAALEKRLGLPFETFKPLIQEYDKAQMTTSPGFSTDRSLAWRASRSTSEPPTSAARPAVPGRRRCPPCRPATSAPAR